MTDAPRIYTVKGLAEYLGTSTTTIYRQLKGWPHFIVGTQPRFTQEHVDQIIQAATKKPVEPEAPRRIGTKAKRNR